MLSQLAFFGVYTISKRCANEFTIATTMGENRFAKDKEGRLIVQPRSFIIGLFLLIPGLEYDNFWYRFSPLLPQEPAAVPTENSETTK